MKKGSAWLVLVLIAALAAGGWYFFRPSLPAIFFGESQVKTRATVEISQAGFSPASVTVKELSPVTWVNRDIEPHWVASDPHPTHTNLRELDSGMMESKGTFTLVFDRAGTYTYHDHLNPWNIKGKIIVTQ